MFNLNKEDLLVYLTDAKSINVEDIINEGYFDLSLFEKKKIYRNVTDIYNVRVIATYQKLLKKILRKDNEFSIKLTNYINIRKGFIFIDEKINYISP